MNAVTRLHRFTADAPAAGGALLRAFLVGDGLGSAHLLGPVGVVRGPS